MPTGCSRGLRDILSSMQKGPETHVVHRRMKSLQFSEKPVSDASNHSEHSTCNLTLIPGLPDSVALHCLARVPRSVYPRLRCVSKAWNRLLSAETHDVFSVREELHKTEAWINFSFSSRPSYNGSSRTSNYFTAFDPGSNQWIHLGWLPGLQPSEVVKDYGFVGLGGKLYVIGGKLCVKFVDEAGRTSETDLFVRKEVLAYDCIGGSWKRVANLKTARVDFACSVSGGRIYVSGGRNRLDHEKAMLSAEVYVPELDQWLQLPDMSIARYKCVGVTLKNKVYVIGGYTLETLHRSSVEIFDPSTKSWQLVPQMWSLDIPPYEVVELHGKLYRSGDQLNYWRGSIDVYDESLNLWKTLRGSRRRLGEDLDSIVPRYVTMVGIGKHLLFFGGHCRLGEHHQPHCFETVDAFKAAVGKWSTLEPFKSSCRELCSPCCVVYA